VQWQDCGNYLQANTTVIMGLSSDHVKHACDEWLTQASRLLTTLTVHGCITDDLSVLPIPKGKSLNYAESANYRGALSFLFGKILDAFVFTIYDIFLASSKLQFGFKVFPHLCAL